MDSIADRTFSNPLPGVSLGDPFVLRDRGRFYLYGTNDGPPLPDGRVVPVYRSDDLIRWEALGGALIPDDPTADHWAPEVLPWNGRYYMVVSFGDVESRGHALWVAVADRPAGPFRLRRRVSDPSERFSIDGSWLLDDDGRLYLFRCVDFVERDDPPHGTGIVVQPMRDPLSPAGPPTTVLRAHSPWHLFEAPRAMPLYGGRRFEEWRTIEGPAPARRGGRYFCGYSGGNYGRNYGTGEAVADSPLGPYRDLRGGGGPIVATTPGLVVGPGHFSIVQPDLVRDWIVLHGRSPGEATRRVWLCPASWGPGGIEVGPLTDRPQPAPPRPTVVGRLAEDGPRGWSLESGRWGRVADGLRLSGADGPGLCRLDGPALDGSWAVECSIRVDEPGPGWGGLLIRGGGALSVSIPAAPDRPARIEGADGLRVEAPLPTLGDDPFEPTRFHAIRIRSEGGRAEVRVDGVVLASGLAAPGGPAHPALIADGAVVADGFAATLVRAGPDAPGRLPFPSGAVGE